MIAHFILAGQSNIDQWFHAGEGAALDVFRETFLELNPEYSDVQFFDAARGGSAMLAESAEGYAARRAPDDPQLNIRISENYWYNEVTQSAGPNLTLFSERLKREADTGTEFLGIIWAQGEADTTFVREESKDDYANGLLFVLNSLMEASGAPAVHIQGLGDRSGYSDELHGGTRLIREVQSEVAEGDDAIVLATTIFDLDLRDTSHLTTEGYSIAARRMAVAISTGDLAPGSGEAILISPTTMLVQLNLSVDQTLVDTVGLGGFSLQDGGEDVPIVAIEVSPAGLLRVESSRELNEPLLTYGAARDSVGMQEQDYLIANSSSGSIAVLPFTVAVAPPAQEMNDLGTGLSIIGSNRSEQIYGLSGQDVIDGGAGHDTIDGGGGRDVLVGGSGSDIFVLNLHSAMGVVRDFDVATDAIGLPGYSAQEITFTFQQDEGLIVLGPAGQQMLLEGVRSEDAGKIVFKTLGTDGSNSLAGHAGGDRIYALGGDDRVDSGAGTDRIWLGDGLDTVVFGTGYGTNVVYDFNPTDDVIALKDLSVDDLSFRSYKDRDLEIRTMTGDRLVLRNLDVDIAEALQILDAPPEFVGIEGTSNADVLRGTSMNEFFEGFAGTDRIYTGGGNDVVVFRAGSDLNIVYDFDIQNDRLFVETDDEDELNILSYKETDAEIRLSSGDRLVLRDVDPDDLADDHFLDVAPEDFV